MPSAPMVVLYIGYRLFLSWAEYWFNWSQIWGRCTPTLFWDPVKFSDFYDLILYFFKHHENVTFRQKWIFDKWSVKYQFCHLFGAVHCCECRQSSHILCVVKIGFEDNMLRGGENDRIANHSEKKQATADQKYQLICQMKPDLDWLSSRWIASCFHFSITPTNLQSVADLPFIIFRSLLHCLHYSSVSNQHDQRSW